MAEIVVRDERCNGFLVVAFNGDESPVWEFEPGFFHILNAFNLFLQLVTLAVWTCGEF